MRLVFRLGCIVQQRDGGRLGELHRVIYDPGTQEVVSVVVLGADLDGQEVVVPIGTVDAADDDAVTLAVDQQQFQSFELFTTRERNIAPPPDAAEVTSDLVHDPLDVPDVPPVGAATGVESIAFTPLIEEVTHVPAGDQVIDGDTTVWATDGELGRVTNVVASGETRRLVSLVVEKGFVFKHQTEVPANLVENVEPETIVLSVPLDAVRSGNNG